jgi:uncharacterized cupin superfamily protein
MKFNYLFLLLLTFAINSLSGQNAIKPILLDKKVISGLGLKPIPQKEEGKEFFQKRLYRGKEISVYVVSMNTWTSQFSNFWFDEFLFILNGQAIIEPDHGEKRVFNSGEYFFAPKGFNGEWTVAADHYYYELSLITNKRADSSIVSPSLFPILLDKDKLSGRSMTIVDSVNSKYHEVLAKGIEIQIDLNAEIPQTYNIDNDKEQLINVLAGVLNLTDAGGKVHQFYKGDFFILPEGYKGLWESKGHQIFKYLSVKEVN